MSDRTIIKCIAVFAACTTAVLLYAILEGGFGIRRKAIFIYSLEAGAFMSIAYLCAGLFRPRI
jgi:hypothetical protein